ncbi:MAG TPA: PsiF family protein [Hyphomicrobiaceae bacterium]|jgi:hypothetical protein|nr:PsiF family protein [Hyphomicrobiaceae bacterium]
MEFPMQKVLAIATLAAALSLGSALTVAAATSKPRSAASIECSKQADAKGLHGKERKKFRAACKKEMAKKKG